jgi:hypothetical protein
MVRLLGATAAAMALWLPALGVTAPDAAQGGVAPAGVTAEGPPQPSPVATGPLAERWGIQITATRLTAGGHLIDFRYRVLDPDKAAALSAPEAKPKLVDQATGATLAVPKTPKIGPLRQSAQKPEAGKVYFVLFGNTGKVVGAGSKVTVQVGDFCVEDLVVE